MKIPKLFIGPLSKNIVDNVLMFNNEGLSIGLVASRRQIDYNDGYVNHWTTRTFTSYVKDINSSVFVCRDHGGPMQGKVDDNGLVSLADDCDHVDIIHIDPWKLCEDFDECLKETVRLMKFCYNKNSNVLFEIGTEESIHKFSANELYDLIVYVRNNISFFSNVKFVVIQSGTKLRLDSNIGEYDECKLTSMVEIAKQFNLLTKEHNGDYIDSSMIRCKFDLGLNAINIAPEFGRMETECYLEHLSSNEKDCLFNLCYYSNTWVKWLNGNCEFDPFQNKDQLIKVCCHYLFSDSKFHDLIKHIDIRETFKERMKERVLGILEEV